MSILCTRLKEGSRRMPALALKSGCEHRPLESGIVTSWRRHYWAGHISPLQSCLSSGVPSLNPVHNRQQHMWISFPLDQSSISSPLLSIRWKHKSAKLGQHLITLDEMAHSKEREEAEERRKKKKDKKASRKSKNDGHDQSAHDGVKVAAALSSEDDESFVDSHHEEDEEENDAEGVLPAPKIIKERMRKQFQRFEDYLRTVRGAEPTPELFDNISVNAYGDPNTPLQSVAQVVFSSPTLATATCFDPALAKAVSNAIRDKLSLNPSVDEGGIVQIVMPRVSLESRMETAAAFKKRTEMFRQRIRGVRRKALDIVKQGVAGKLEHVSKDDAFRVQKEIESIADDFIQKINTAADKKHESIMSV